MKLRFLLIGVILASCGKNSPVQDTRDVFAEEEAQKRAYYNSILDHPTKGLYKDFDLFRFEPLNKISSIGDTIPFPMIEVLKNDSGRIKKLTIHFKTRTMRTIFSD